MNAPIDSGVIPYVLSDTRDGVRTLTLNRGERYNALSRDMLQALEREIDDVAATPAVRAVVIAAAGKGFCAGHDLKELRAHPDEGWQRELFGACSRVMVKLTELPQPVIARVHGIATAAGCQLVSMCDLAVAADTARFALPGVNVGVFCSTPAVGVVRNVSRKRVMELLLTGEAIAAQDAARIGLVNRVVAAGTERDEAVALARKIAAKSGHVVKIGKEAFYRQIDMDLARAYDYATDVMVENMMARDAAEGISAFIEKRTAKWEDD